MHDRNMKGRGALLITMLVLGVVSALAVTALAQPVVGQKQPAEDAALLRELAERLFLPHTEAWGARFMLVPGALQADLPFDLPLPPESVLIGSAVRSIHRDEAEGRRPVAFTEALVILDVPGAPAEIIAFYDHVLGEPGWFFPGGGRPPGGTWPPDATRAGRVFCASVTGPSVTLSAFSEGIETSDVRMQIVVGAPLPVPCGGVPRPLAP